MADTTSNAMRVIVDKAISTEELLKYKYVTLYIYTVSENAGAPMYYGVRVVVYNEPSADSTVCAFDILFNNAEAANACSMYLLHGSADGGSCLLPPLSVPISSDQNCIFARLKKNWSGKAESVNGRQWFDSEKWQLTYCTANRYLTTACRSTIFNLNQCISNLGPFEQIEEGNFMDQITEAEQQDKMDIITTTEKEEYKQEYLTIKNFMELRYEEIYGRRPEPSDTNKIIADVNALTNTQIMKGDYEWWALTQVAHYHYHVPLLKFSRTVSSNGAINISELHGSVAADLIHLYGAERVLGMSTATHRLGIIVKR